MTREKAIDIIKAEKECVCRQGRTGECCRDDLGCGACDLVQEDVDIIEAYDMAIEALKTETKKCPICGSDLYEHCFMCCYEGEKVNLNEHRGGDQAL